MVKHRKTHRRRHAKRRTTRRMRGGYNRLSPADYGSYNLGGKDLPQGQQFASMHIGQHGGAAPLAVMGQPFLSQGEAAIARTNVLDLQLAQTAGMSDQSGGRRRRRKSKGKKTHRRSRNMYGGAYVANPAQVDWQEAIGIPKGVNPQFASFNAAA